MRGSELTARGLAKKIGRLCLELFEDAEKRDKALGKRLDNLEDKVTMIGDLITLPTTPTQAIHVGLKNVDTHGNYPHTPTPGAFHAYRDFDGLCRVCDREEAHSVHTALPKSEWGFIGSLIVTVIATIFFIVAVVLWVLIDVMRGVITW